MVTKKVVILCSMLVLLLVLNLGNLSAWEFDNAKDYDVETKEVTIKNAFGLGSDVAKIKLNTPQNVVVPRGYQKVAEFDLIHLKNDNGGLNLIEFYNTKTSMSKFEREFDFKVKGIEQIDVNDYETICKDVWNETSKNMSKSCTNKIIGTHKEDKDVWNDYDFKSLVKEEKITIGIFTDVKKGDKVEWIPTFYGVEIKEWATWTESLNVGLYAYYQLEDDLATTVVIDAIGNTNGVASVNTNGLSAVGKVNDGFDLESGSSNYVDTELTINTEVSRTNPLSISAWVKAESLGSGVYGNSYCRNWKCRNSF